MLRTTMLIIIKVEAANWSAPAAETDLRYTELEGKLYNSPTCNSRVPRV